MEEAAKSKLISHYISTLSIGHNYICTHCLIHMGDIARYKGQVKQAESFYKHSLTVSPASGHSYNQLALVEVSKGSNLSAVFFYIRALALKGPFPAASTNLSR